MFGDRHLWRAVFRPMVGLLAALLLVVPGAALAQTQEDMGHLGMKSGADFEIDWMSGMIEHHQGAIDMANLALTQANHQEIKDISAMIIRDQQREIGEMTLWLQQWHNTKPLTGMMHGGMEMTSRLRNLSGDAFDRAFLILMHEHHRGAIMMAQMVPTRAMHDELKTLAQNIITSQEAEVQQFVQWATAWYNLDLMAQGTMGGGMMGGGMMEGPGQTVGMPRTGDPFSPLSLAIWLSTLFIIAGAIMLGNAHLHRKA